MSKAVVCSARADFLTLREDSRAGLMPYDGDVRCDWLHHQS